MNKKKTKNESLPPIQDKYFNVNKIEETEIILKEKELYIKTLLKRIENYETELQLKEDETV